MRGKRPVLILINLLLSFIVMAQDRIDSLRGCYAISYGFGGRKVTFEPDGRFRMERYDCVGITDIDSGFWKSNGDSSFFLESTRFKNRFHIIDYDGHLFLISDAERPMFIQDFSALDRKYVDGKTYGSKRWPATKSQMIYNRLAQKYFVRRIIMDH